MNGPQVLVTGMGVVSAIGMNAEENFKNLLAEQSGIGPISILPTKHQGLLPAGEIKYSTDDLFSLAGISHQKAYSRSTLLALIASKEALQQAGITPNRKIRTGLVSATTVGGMDKSEDFFSNWKSGRNFSLSNILTHDGGESTSRLASELGIYEYTTTISTACSSAANAIMLGARLIKNNILDRVVVGGTDAFTRFTLNGFNTLLILDQALCTPFDKDRKGLNLGEGAAYLVLESEKSAKGKTVYGLVSGYANANDAFHQTASSPEGTGAYLAMQQALSTAGLKTHEIDYVNVHGTGTPNNDLTEGIAMERLFGAANPPFSSTKPYTGHTLAACGAIEAIYSIYAIRESVAYPNLRFTNKIEEHVNSPIKTFLKKEVRHVLSNSFGFGGNNTSLVFSRV
jgi:3-oxoacyl-(acyl-carrier-protein) synthase